MVDHMLADRLSKSGVLGMGLSCGYSLAKPDSEISMAEVIIAVDEKYDVPREDIVKYAFVLKPMLDMEPQLVHPGNGQTIAEIWQDFAATDAELKQVQFELT